MSQESFIQGRRIDSPSETRTMVINPPIVTGDRSSNTKCLEEHPVLDSIPILAIEQN